MSHSRFRCPRVYHGKDYGEYELVHKIKFDENGNDIYEYYPREGYEKWCEDFYDETIEILKTYKYGKNKNWIECDTSEKTYRNYETHKHLNEESLNHYKSKRKYGDFSQVFKNVEEEIARIEKEWEDDEFRDLPF